MAKTGEAVTRYFGSRPQCPRSSVWTERRAANLEDARSNRAGGKHLNWGTQCANTAYPHPDEPARADRDEAVSPVVV